MARRVVGGAGGERVWGSVEEHERTVHCPLMALGMDSMASAQLKGGRPGTQVVGCVLLGTDGSVG